MTHALSAAEYGGPMRHADPGYGPDKQKRLPLGSESECRSAWTWINDPANAKAYTPAQLARIKARIKAAGARYGIDFAAPVNAAAELRDVELARVGTWHLRTGPLSVTPKHLDDAARFANREGARPAYLKIGHSDQRFMAGDGEPALGWVHNVRVEEDDAGHVLKGDLTGMPDWLATAMPHAWPDRSIEGWEDYEHDGQKYSLVMEGLALLGVTPPGMASIKSLRDLPQALGVAASASGRRIVASFGDTSVSAPEAADPTPPIRQGAGMDPVKIREALGLSADASDEEVGAALTSAGFTVNAPPPEPAPVAAAAAPGTLNVAASVWEEQQKTIRTLSEFVTQTKRNERDDVIAKAVQAGKFTPAQRPHFSKLWDADPDGTRALIGSLVPNSALAVMASGYAGDASDTDVEYSALFGKVG